MAKVVTKVLYVRPKQLRLSLFYNENVPLVPKKKEALVASFKSAKVWPSIIVRPSPDNAPDAPDRAKVYELTFGRHRLAAIRELEEDDVYCELVKTVPVICDESLTDEQMLKYMALENSQDYGSDFIQMYAIWEAGKNYIKNNVNIPTGILTSKVSTIDVAKVLGWIKQLRGNDRPNKLAQTCITVDELFDKVKLLKAEYGHQYFPFTLDKFKGMSVNQVRMQCDTDNLQLSTDVEEIIEERKSKKSKKPTVVVEDDQSDDEQEVDVEAELDEEEYEEPLPKKKEKTLDDKKRLHQVYLDMGKLLVGELDRMLVLNGKVDTPLRSFSYASEELLILTSAEKKIQERVIQALQGVRERTNVLIALFIKASPESSDTLPEHKTVQ